MRSDALNRLSTRAIPIAAAMIFLASLVAVGCATWQFRSDVITDSTAHVRNLALLLRGQLERSIQSIDISILDLRERIAWSNVETGLDLANLAGTEVFRTLLRERASRLPQARGVLVYDADGKALATTLADGELHIGPAARDYFQEIREGAAGGLTISRPIADARSGPTILFGRRITSAAGRFLGAILVPVTADYFERICAPLTSNGDMRLTLVRGDGTVIVRYPGIPVVTGTKLPAGSPWYGLVAKGGGEFRSPGYFDTVPRWFAVRPLDDYPLVLNVGISEAAMLARWHGRAIAIGIGTVTLLSVAAFLLWAALRQFQGLRRSERHLREKTRALAVSNMRFDSALNNISQGLCMFDANRRVVVSNARFAAIYNLAPLDIVRGTAFQDIIEILIRNGTCSVDSRQIDLAELPEETSKLQLLPDGRAIFIRCHRMADGGWMTTHEDITDRHRSESQIAYMARHDLLTGLFNRATFSEKIEEAGARLQRFGETFTVLLLDLDRFKQINDTMGHPAGDALLKQSAERLRASLRETDVLARFGGDEFAIIQVGNTDQRHAAIAFADRIIALLSAPYNLGDQTVTISTSIGIALAPEHGVDPDTLIRNADLALYRAKGQGRNGYSIYDVGLMEVANARRKLEGDLREAIKNDEFVLHYQAIVDARTGNTCGAEALVRWRHPRRGLVGPLDFVPLAEETGLIEQIGEWVLHRACAEAVAWPDHTIVAVNLSPAQFGKSSPVELVKKALAATGLPARRLEIEITENVFLAGSEDVISMVKQMKELGVSIALDDFGTGYSSLSYLTTFPFDKVKIDRSFTMNMTKRADCAAVIASVITLTRCLGVTTTAEGVETRPQFELLRDAGVDFCQGFLFGRPTPAADLDVARILKPGRGIAAA